MPAPSSRPGDACTPSSAGAVVELQPDIERELGQPVEPPAGQSAPRVHENERSTATNTSKSSGSASTSAAYGPGRSPVSTYRSVLPEVKTAFGRLVSSSSVPTGSGPIATRSPSTHQRSTPRSVPSAMHRLERRAIAVDVGHDSEPHPDSLARWSSPPNQAEGARS